MKLNISRSQAGFSLLEMVVAVAILGISLGMLYQAAGGATRSISTTEDYSYAIAIAESLIANYSAVPPQGVSVIQQTADGYTWQVTSSPISVDETAESRLHYLDVWVRWGEHEQRSVHLASTVVVQEEPDESF